MQFKWVLAAAAFAIPAYAQAQPVTGLYVGGGAGWNWIQDSDLDLRGNLASGLTGVTGGPASGSIEAEDGVVGVLALGWGFGNGLRAELEGSYRENSLDSISGFVAGGLSNTGGKWRGWGAMVNVLYDFHIGDSPIVPYIGAGIGWQRVQIDGGRARGPSGGQLLVDDEADVFAYQAIVGAAYEIPSVPGLAITAEYRFLGTPEPDMGVRVIGPGGASARGSSDVNYMNHSVMLGLRYAFNVPMPPPPPVAAPMAPAMAPSPSRTYLVFFDFDRADLTDRARQIVSEAAQASKTTQTTRIEVAGHADRSGSPQYNQRLSERRAQMVGQELGRLGVPASAISIQAFGESRPLVATADGVREPQNRRVEIVLR